MGRMHPLYMAIQLVTPIRQFRDQVRRILTFRRAKLPSPTQIVQNRFLVCLIAVKFEAGAANARGVQASLHHFKCRHLFGDK